MNSLVESRSKVLLGFIDQALETIAASGILRSYNGIFGISTLMHHIIRRICVLLYIYIYKHLLRVLKVGTPKIDMLLPKSL